jgi:tRNA (mo5U34)-methyltransferase
MISKGTSSQIAAFGMIAAVPNDLSAEVGKFPWFHSIDLGHGVITPGIKSLKVCRAEADAIFGRVNLAGLSVIDVGAWNGFFSFEAQRRGAARVLATDSYCWTSTHFRGRETFELARTVLALDVEACKIDVAQLEPGGVGMFDVVLFLGVFYRRYDAIDSLARVASLARQLLVVETHLDLRHLDRPAMVFYPGSELGNDGTNWWGPNELCMEALLRGHGFAEVEKAAHPTVSGRGIFHAWRSTERRLAPLAAVDRLKSGKPDLRTKIVRELRRPFRRWIG